MANKSTIPLLARFHTQLFVLIALVFVPSLILTIHTNLNERRTRKQNVREGTIALAKLAAARQENFIKNAEQMLGTISRISFLVSTTNRYFSQIHLINLRKLSPEYLDIGLIETNGTLFCSTVVTNEAPNLSKWSCFQRVVNSQKFSIGDLDQSSTSGELTLDFGYPVFDEKGVFTRVFFASLDLNRFGGIENQLELPDNSAAVTVLDGSGSVLARYPNARGLIGKSLANDPLIHRILHGNQDVFEMRAPNGMEKLFATATLSDGVKKRVWVSVGIPTKTSFASANQALWKNIIILALVALLALAAAYFYAEHFFLIPMHLLLSQARLLAAGRWINGSKIPHGKGELGELARTFDEMALTLEKSRTQIELANDELEQRVSKRTAQLEEANRELEAFSYSVSHDLRAPLRHIAGFNDLLRDEIGGAASPKSIRFLEIIKDSARQMGQLIDDLLVFSRMGRVELQETVVDTNKIVNETIALLEREIGERKVVWKRSELPRLRADPALLRQVFANLLSNAVKYTKPREVTEIEIGFESKENETVIFVRDNGVGFDMQFASKLFGVFQRLHQADEFEGTGIGLANVRRIIQRHGGRTWAEGIIGRGATFYFSLPQKAEQPKMTI